MTERVVNINVSGYERLDFDKKMKIDFLRWNDF